MADKRQDLVLHLFECGAVKFGKFTLKSGIESPIYLDLRVTVSFPDLLQKVADAMWASLEGVNFDICCGVPYTALPFSTVISLQHNKPMVIRRKEKKNYGTMKLIDGVYTEGQNCLVVEDIVSSGASVMETVKDLRDAGLLVTEAVVLIDRQQNGRTRLEKEGLHLHSVLTITEVLEILHKAGKLEDAVVESVKQFIKDNQFSA
eukprot:Colp12_sorted_trinity150504_noHs@17038